MADKIVLPVYSLNGEKTGEIELASDVFGVKDANAQPVHDAVVVALANARQATAKTKKRHEVSGGGKKPWRQKGTGRARAGSSRSPIWVGGGKVFGPDGNQNYTLSQNKKAHALALKTVLSEKVEKGLLVVDSLHMDKVSSKDFVANLKNLKATGKVLVVAPKEETNILLSARNLEGVKVVGLNNVSVYDLLNANYLLIAKAELESLEGGLR